MPGVAPQQSRTFDPVAAQAALRRDRVAKIRTTATFKGATTFGGGKGGAVRKEDYDAANRQSKSSTSGDPKDWKPMERGFQGTSPWKEGDAVRKDDYDAANRKPEDRYAGSPQDWKPMGGDSFKGAPKFGDGKDGAVRKEDYDAANRKPTDRLAGNPKDWKPMGGDSFKGAPFRKTNDSVRKEDYDRRNTGTQSSLDSNPDNWKPMGGNGFKGSPLPQQLNGPDSNLPVRSREEDAANRQMDAAEASGDFAAQNRARAMQNRAQKKAADRAVPVDDGEPSEAMQALSKFVTHGSATTGIGILLTQSVMLYRFFLTVYPSYDEQLRSWGMLKLVPGKYDLRKATDIFDLILCVVELGLFIILLVVGFVIFLVRVRAIV